MSAFATKQTFRFSLNRLSLPHQKTLKEARIMPKFRKSLQIFLLFLFLLAGQLQAQSDFSCSMIMDINSSESGQDDHKSCPNLDYDNSDKLNAPVSDLVLELDADPTEEKLTTFNPIYKLRATTLLSRFSYTNYYQTGSKIHLITQRLRI